MQNFVNGSNEGMSDQPFRQKWAFILAIIVLLGMSALKLYLSTRGTPVNSDNALPAILFESLRRGLLNGWHLAPDNYLISDLPFYVISFLLFGPSTSATWGTAIVVSSFSLLAIAIAINRIVGQWEAVIFTILCTVPLILGRASHLILRTPFLHIMTIGSSIWLAAQVIIDVIASPSVNWRRLVVYAILGSFMELSDPFFLFTCIIPLILIGAWYATSHKSKRFGLLTTLIFATISIFFAILEKRIVESLSNTIYAPDTKLFPLNYMWFHIYLMIKSMLNLLGTNLLHGGIAILPSFIKLMAISYLVVYIIKKYKVKNLETPRQTFVAYLEAMGVIILAAFLLSANALNIWGERFLFPVAIGVLIFTSMGIVEHFRKYGKHITLVLILSVLCTGLSMLSIQPGKQPSPYAQIARELQAHHIQYGYSGYDHATSVTFASNGAVRIRAVATTESGNVRPYNWVSNSQWYQPGSFTGPTCLILSPSLILHDLTVSSLETLFGKPSDVFSVQGMKVIVWPYNISNRFK